MAKNNYYTEDIRRWDGHSIIKGEFKKSQDERTISNYIPEICLIYLGRENWCSERIIQNLRNV